MLIVLLWVFFFQRMYCVDDNGSVNVNPLYFSHLYGFFYKKIKILFIFDDYLNDFLYLITIK